jgi:transposase
VGAILALVAWNVTLVQWIARPKRAGAQMAHPPQRFYNASLRYLYDSCPVQVRATQPPGALKAHHFAPSFVENCDDARSGFLQRDRRPRWLPPEPELVTELARPFRPEAEDSDDDAAAPVAKKRRKRERVGAYRQYRVRMIPTAAQKRELKRCFAAARHAYNWFVDRVENRGDAPNEYALTKDYRASTLPEWAKGVATQIRAGGIADAANAYKSNIAKRKLHPGEHGAFKVKYRSHRKTRTESIHVEGDGDYAVKHSSLLAFQPLPFANNPALRSECAVFFGNNLSGLGERYWDAETPEERTERLNLQKETGKRIGARRPKWRTAKGADGIRLQDKPHVIARLLAEGRNGDGMGVVNGCKIHWDKRKDSWHLLYCYELPPLVDPDPSFETKRLVATDPGVREFMTWYAPATGDHGELFKGGEAQIQRRCARIDDLTSRMVLRGRNYATAAPRRTRRQRRQRFRQMRRTLARERCRLHDYVGAGHYAAANHLLRHHELVIAPQLATSRMVPRDGRVFGSKTARAMLTWSHGLFTQRLHSVAYRHPGRHVISDSGEPGTSKTCGDCGHWNAQLGGDKTYSCTVCGTVIGRDLNGARNNFFAAYGAARGIGWDGVHR